jgi:hypothetical protein
MFFKFTVDIIRRKIPYEIITTYELGKKYEVHCFPILDMKKFYHKGKLHRETKPAIIYYGDNPSAYEQDLKRNLDEYYINGIKINKKNLKKEIF